jgi:hypothetical protein
MAEHILIPNKEAKLLHVLENNDILNIAWLLRYCDSMYLNDYISMSRVQSM